MAQIGVIKDTVQVIVGLTRLSMFLLGEQNLVYHLFVCLFVAEAAVHKIWREYGSLVNPLL